MPLNLSPQEAAAALTEIDQTRATMRRVVREHRGHVHFWIWGASWVAMPLSAQLFGEDFCRHFWILATITVPVMWAYMLHIASILGDGPSPHPLVFFDALVFGAVTVTVEVAGLSMWLRSLLRGLYDIAAMVKSL